MYHESCIVTLLLFFEINYPTYEKILRKTIAHSITCITKRYFTDGRQRVRVNGNLETEKAQLLQLHKTRY